MSVTRPDLKGTAMNATDPAARLAEIVALAKEEILADIAEGIVPDTVGTFGELHDHVDANCYGGLCDEGATTDFVDFVGEPTPADPHARANYIQDLLDSWLQAGRVDSASCEVCDADVLASPDSRRAFADQRPDGVLVCSIACRDEAYRLLLADVDEYCAPAQSLINDLAEHGITTAQVDTAHLGAVEVPLADGGRVLISSGPHNGRVDPSVGFTVTRYDNTGRPRTTGVLPAVLLDVTPDNDPGYTPAGGQTRAAKWASLAYNAATRGG